MAPTTSHSRKSPAVRRQEILDAVVALASAKGLDGVRTRDVAEQVGVAPGLIHHYFPSMDDLLAESFGQWADALLAQLQRIPDELPARTSLALLVAEMAPEQRLWTDALTTASRFDLLRERARELSVAYLDHVAAIIQAGIDEGTFTCANPRESAWRLILTLDGLVAMVHTLGLIEPAEVPFLVGPVVENDLGLQPGSFTELVQAVAAAGAEMPSILRR